MVGDIADSPNGTPFLNSGDVPGFQMTTSINRPSRGLVYEQWAKPASDGSKNASLIKLSVYPLKSRSEAFATAKKTFGAIKNEDQNKMMGRPTPGSFSGQPVGYFCWAYTTGFVPRNSSSNESASIIVVKGSYLFRLQVVGGTELVDDSFVEKIGRKVARRLKTWPRPSGFDQGETDDEQDSD